MTDYIVLKKSQNQGSNGDHLWLQGPTVAAVSAEAAVRKAIDDKGGTYVAVPLRSFQELVVTVETKRTVKVA